MNTILLQPSYGTPIAQYAAIAQADAVIWEVCDNFQKQTYRNRMCIATSKGLLRLSIPIVHAKGSDRHQRTQDVLLDYTDHWQRDHWRSIKVAYQTSPYFEFYEDSFQPVFETTYEKLAHLHTALHAVIMDCLQLEIPTSKTAQYSKTPSEIDLRYLIQAKSLPIDEDDFSEYNQVFEARHPFLPNLTVLDLLFNEGPNAITYLENLAIIGK